MRKYCLLFIIIAFPFLFLMGCIKDVKKTNPVGKVYRDSIQLWGKNIPLPEGEWKVIGRGAQGDSTKQTGPFDQQARFFEIVLFKEFETKQVHSILFISIESMANNSPGYIPNEYLKRKDVHHVVVKNNSEQGAQDGWLINHFIIDFDIKNNPALQEAYNYLLTNKIVIPKLLIQTFHHFTGKYKKNRYLDVKYYTNPEIEGFESPNETRWGSSEWHPLRINNDPKKMAYIEKLKTEGAIMHEKIRVGFGD